jgi:hypothetical protein
MGLKERFALWQIGTITGLLIVIIMGAMTIFEYMAASFDFHDADLVEMANDNPNAINYIMAYITIGTVSVIVSFRFDPPIGFEASYYTARFTLLLIVLIFFVQGNMNVQAIVTTTAFICTILCFVFNITVYFRGGYDDELEMYDDVCKSQGRRFIFTNYMWAKIQYLIKTGQNVLKPDKGRTAIDPRDGKRARLVNANYGLADSSDDEESVQRQSSRVYPSYPKGTGFTNLAYNPHEDEPPASNSRAYQEEDAMATTNIMDTDNQIT